MLPDRSKRYAVTDRENPRLVLTNPWQLALIAMLVLTLLVTIFPRKALVDTLYSQNDLDPLTLSYIQNLYRAETSNVDVALLLARSQSRVKNIQSLEPTLLRVTEQGTTRQSQEAYAILFESYNRELLFAMAEADKVRLTHSLSTLLQRASKVDLPVQTVRAFALRSFELGIPRTGMVLLDKLHILQPQRELEELGNQALARGRYENAASYFLLARDRAQSIDEARRLFQKGIKTYMAASLFELAMREAVQPLGELEADLPTLRFLSRTAIVAGDPMLAASFARKLVFTTSDSREKP